MERRSFCQYILFFFVIFFAITPLFAESNKVNIATKYFTVDDATRHKTMSCLTWYPTSDAQGALVPKGLWAQTSSIPNGKINIDVPTAHQGKLPLIILSHGYQGSPESLSWFAENLAKHGYIVIGIQHIDTRPDGKPYMEYWNRAIDISVLLKQLKQLPFVDFERVGMAGYSLGTATGLWLAGGVATTYKRTINPGRQFGPQDEFPPLDSSIAGYLLHHTDFKAAKRSYREPLIKAVFLMAPGYGWAFDEKHLADIQVPVFLVAAEGDEMLYVDTNAYYFSKYIPGSSMKIMPDVGHFVFLSAFNENANLTPAEKKTMTLLENAGKYRYTKEKRQQVHDEVDALAVQFFKNAL